MNSAIVPDLAELFPIVPVGGSAAANQRIAVYRGKPIAAKNGISAKRGKRANA